MEIYVEYAFLENFLFDGVLLTLALKSARERLRLWRILGGAVFGAVFAIVYPLLRLPSWLGYALKFSVGALLCLMAFGQVKTRKEWGRYAFTTVFFFIYAFGFGGVLLAVTENFNGDKAPSWFVMIGFAILSAVALFFVRKLYEKKRISRFLYDCRLLYKNKTVTAVGFLDSGNLAVKNGLPVCFLSPDLGYTLFGEEILEGGGQVCDEIKISTLGGEKTAPLYEGGIEIKTNGEKRKRRVYFAVATNMLSREHKIILSSYIFENSLDEENRS